MEGYGHLVGHRFAGGTYTLPGWLSWSWADVAQLPSTRTGASRLRVPVAMHGTGVTIEDIFDRDGSTADMA